MSGPRRRSNDVRIPDKQAVFFELDGVLTREPQLDADGEIPWYDGAIEALQRIAEWKERFG